MRCLAALNVYLAALDSIGPPIIEQIKQLEKIFQYCSPVHIRSSCTLQVAVKVIDKMKLDAATRVQMLQEVQLMKLVQHPHVVSRRTTTPLSLCL